MRSQLTIIFATLLSYCDIAGAATHAINVRWIVEHHDDAYRRGDIKEIMADYAPDAVVTMSTGTFKGLAEIQRLFQTYVDKKIVPERETFVGTVESVTRSVVLQHWSIGSGKSQHKSGTDIIVVRHGKIIYQAQLSR